MSDKKSDNKPDNKPLDESDWLDELYAEGEEELPPPQLDARIQAAARSHARRPWYLRRGQLTTLATAASLVLAAMVIYYVPGEPQAPASEGLVLPENREPESREETVQSSDPGVMRRISDTPDSATALAEEETDGAVTEMPTPSRQNTSGRLQTSDTPSQVLQEQEMPLQSAPQADNTGVRAVVRSPEPAAAPKEAKKAERYRIATDELDEMRANLPADSTAMGRASADLDVEARLAELCGQLPGTAETRSLSTDAVDWYLTVSDDQSTSGVATDSRYWRCQDGAWIELATPIFELPSDEQ